MISNDGIDWERYFDECEVEINNAPPLAAAKGVTLGTIAGGLFWFVFGAVLGFWLFK